MTKRTWIDDCEDDEESNWPIPGIICPTLTLISGQPKHGKSMFVGHCANALINQTEIFNREVLKGEHIVGWMGYDADWKVELKQRWKSQAQNKIALYEPIRNLQQNNWDVLYRELEQDKVTLFVLDHLYGIGGTSDLNDALEVNKVFSVIRPIYTDLGIPTVLLAQAGKGQFSRGRAAHSVALEGEARQLIRIHNKKANDTKSLELTSNMGKEESFTIKLNVEQCEIVASKTIRQDSEEPSQRNGADKVRRFLKEAEPVDLLCGWSGAGRALAKLGMSANCDSGRSMAKRWEKSGLLQNVDGQIVPGDSLILEYNAA